MKKIVYTKEMHAEVLLKFFSDETIHVCSRCPVMIFAKEHTFGKKGEIKGCLVCRGFVRVRGKCPCYRLGKKESVKRTWLALEEGGYI